MEVSGGELNESGTGLRKVPLHFTGESEIKRLFRSGKLLIRGGVGLYWLMRLFFPIK